MSDITVVYKHDIDSPAMVMTIDNTLHAFQSAVGGFIETVQLTTEYIVICNEMGRMLELDENVLGLAGPFIVCCADGDEFASVPMDETKRLMRLLDRR